jgi:glucan phosphorylase
MSDTPSSLRGIDVDPKGDLEALREGFVDQTTTTSRCVLGPRSVLLDRWVRSARSYLEGEHRTVIYLSAEYLMGPQLGHNLLNLGDRGRAAREAARLVSGSTSTS